MRRTTAYASAQADYEFARQSLAAQVARSWFTAIETKLQLEAAESMAASARALVSLAQDRQRVGNGSEKDVALARAGLGHDGGLRRDRPSSPTRRPCVRSRSSSAATRQRNSQVATRLPDMPGPVPVGMPLDMLERRPDIIAAERRVAAAFNRVGEAKAARLPTIRLNASIAALSSDVLTAAGRLQQSVGWRRRHAVRASLPGREP